MPNLNWDLLTGLQLGHYAEYYAKMEFASYGLEVYTSEVDDHGVDFVAKRPEGTFYEVQVKSLREANKGNYAFVSKSKMDIDDAKRLVCFIYFINNKFPLVYTIPATAWQKPNAVLVDRKYDKPNQKSEPEWGIMYSKKNRGLLDMYKIETYIVKI